MIYLVLFFISWVAISAVGIKQKQSKVMSIAGGFLASIGVLFVSLQLFDKKVQTEGSTAQAANLGYSENLDGVNAQALPGPAKHMDLAGVLSSGEVRCVTRNPDNSITNEQWIFNEDKSFVVFTTTADPMYGTYSIAGKVVNGTITSFASPMYFKIDVKDYSSEFVNFSLTTKASRRQSECDVTPL